jgi:hypothetical protein
LGRIPLASDPQSQAFSGRRDGAATQTRQELQDHKMKTVFVHVNTSKQVGDANHVKIFANIDVLVLGASIYWALAGFKRGIG